MKDKQKNRAGKSRQKARESSRLAATPVPSVEIESVLEHISSPYRWEVLEVPTVPPKNTVPNKAGH